MGEIWKRHATRWGLISGLAAVVLWPAHASMPDALRIPFVAVLLLTAGAGLSLLVIITVDLATVRRSRLARPARAFDLALGLLLAVPSAAMLQALL